MSTHAAFKTWEAEGESLMDVERRIHDGVKDEDLVERGRRYVRRIFENFPWFEGAGARSIVEVGPGVGYIMQAMAEKMDAPLVGLDVAEGMIANARKRAGRDGLSEKLSFRHYDGVNFPWRDAEIGAFYSVAAMQHVPKPLVYNILLEMGRCLAPGGCAAVHLLSWGHLPYSAVSFAQEVKNQIAGAAEHWHHYWDATEAAAVVKFGIQPSHFEIKEELDQLWIGWRK